MLSYDWLRLCMNEIDIYLSIQFCLITMVLKKIETNILSNFFLLSYTIISISKFDNIGNDSGK